MDATLARIEAQIIRESDLNPTGKLILASIYRSPGADMPSARGTWWGAVNGVTYWIDHKIGRTADTRLTQSWFGSRARLKLKGFELAERLAGVKR